jgi:hypothetical protein
MLLPDWSTPLPTQDVGRPVEPRALTIRPALPADRDALLHLAAVDSQPVPNGALLVGEVGGELWAAVSLDGAITVADPFRPSAEVVLLLHERARQLRGGPRRGGLGRLSALPA